MTMQALIFITVLCFCITYCHASWNFQEGNDLRIGRKFTNYTDEIHFEEFERRMSDIRGISLQDEIATRAFFEMDTVNFAKSIHLHDNGLPWDREEMLSFGHQLCNVMHNSQSEADRKSLKSVTIINLIV